LFLLAQSSGMAKFLELRAQNRFEIKLPIAREIDFVVLDFPYKGSKRFQ